MQRSEETAIVAAYAAGFEFDNFKVFKLYIYYFSQPFMFNYIL